MILSFLDGALVRTINGFHFLDVDHLIATVLKRCFIYLNKVFEMSL